MVVSMLETAVLFFLITTLWIAIRRRASPQLGFVLFFLVLLKPLVPVSYYLPDSLTQSLPRNLWVHFSIDGLPPAILQRDFANEPTNLRPQGNRSLTDDQRVQSPKQNISASSPSNAVLDAAAKSPVLLDKISTDDQQKSNVVGSDSDSKPHTVMAAISRLSFASWFMLAWLTGLLVMCSMFVRSHYRFAALLRRGIDCRNEDVACDITSDVSQRFRTLLAKLADRGVLPDHVCVRLSNEVSIPCVAGMIRPTILLPTPLVQNCRDEELEWILLHEIAHVARYDLPIMLVQRIGFWLQYTNPFVWLANRRLAEFREYACDDCALAWSGIDPITAGQAFLRVVSASAGQHPPFRTALRLASYSPQSARKNRLSRLLSARPVREKLGRCDWLLIVVVGLLLLPNWRLASSPVTATEPVSVQQPADAADANQDQPGVSTPDQALSPFELLVVGPDQQPIPHVVIEVRGREKIPVERIKIGSLERENAYSTRIKTDEQGRLRLQLPSKRSPAFSIMHPGYGPYWIEWGNDPRPENFTAELDAGVSVGGIIVNEAGQPIVRANVSLRIEFKKRRGDSKPLSVGDTPQTDQDGRWRFDNIPANLGTFAVEIRHPEYASLVKSLAASDYTLAEQQGPTEKLVMTEGLVVTGKVVDHLGAPIAGALVRTKHLNDLRQAVTNEAGEYRLTGCKPEVAPLVVSAKDKAFDMRFVDLDTNLEPVDFVMQPGGHVRVRVIDQDGNPVPRATVFFQGWREPVFRYFEFQNVNWIADENGVWEWNEAPLDEFKADIGHRNGMGLSNQAMKAREEVYLFQVHPRLILSGKVIDARTKAPLTNFQVTPGVRDDSGQIFWADVATFTAVEGRFEYPPDRDYPAHMVKVQAAGYATATSREVMSHEGRVELSFELEPSPGIQAQVLTPAGEPAAGAYVALGTADTQIVIKNGEFARGSTLAPQTRTDEQGRFQFPEQTGDYQLIIIHPSGFADFQQRTSNPDQAPAPIRLTAWAEIEGTYQIAGQPAAGIGMSISSDAMDSQVPGLARIVSSHETVTDQQGRYRFSRVFPGAGSVGRNVQRVVGQGAAEVTSSIHKRAVFAAGESTRIDFEGSGAILTGHLIPEREVAPRVWRFVDISIRVDREVGLPPLPLGFADLAAEAKAQGIEQWLTTEAGKTWYAAEHPPSYQVTVDREGRFQVEDMLSGNYVLQVSTHGAETSVHRRNYKFSIPDDAVAGRQSVDLGEIAVTVSSPAGTPN